MGPRKYKPVTIGGFVIDAALSESHTRSARVTQYPVEKGSTFTDNIVIDPAGLVLECCVSDTPLEPIASLRGADSVRWSDEAYQQINSMFSAREPIQVVTAIETYDRMVITNISTPRRSDDGGALLFSITFTQIDVRETERTLVKVAVPRSSKKQSLGHRPAVKPDGVAPINAARAEARARNARAEDARKEKLSWLGEGRENLRNALGVGN